MSSNPYAAPRAAVSDIVTEVEEYQEIEMWSSNGRIGRLRYLAYSFGSLILAGFIAQILTRFMGAPGTIIAGLVSLATLAFCVLAAIKRSHDMDWSGWTVLVAWIPFVGLIWVFKGGTEGTNEYGAPPPPNTTGVRILGLLLPIIYLVGILAAIAIPAYAEYMRRSAGG